MKKSIFFVIAYCFLVNNLFSQVDNLEERLNKKAPNCRDIEYNAMDLIEDLYNKNKIDSIFIVMDYWENKCGLSEPLLRFRILFNIEDKTFSENLYDSTVINFVNEYAYKIEPCFSTYYYDNNSYPLNTNFDNLTKKLASDLINKVEKKSLEYLFCKLYSDSIDYFYNLLKTTNYNQTKIQKYYLRRIKHYEQMIEGNMGFTTGLWMPLNNASILGIHPNIGFLFGLKYKKIQYDLNLSLKFINTPNSYKVIYKDSLINTNHFLGAYIGLDLSYELFRDKNIEFDMLGGIAYDEIDFVSTSNNSNNNNNNYKSSTGSLNLNVGVGWRFYLKGMSYLALQTKYNFVNYDNPHGTDLSGNTITINLIYGACGNRIKYNNLKYMRWKE